MNELVITTVALLNVTCWPLSIAREVFNTQWLHHKESNQCTLSLGGFLYKVMWKNLTDTWGHQDNNFTSMNIVCEYRIRIFVWFLFSPLPQLKHRDMSLIPHVSSNLRVANEHDFEVTACFTSLHTSVLFVVSEIQM